LSSLNIQLTDGGKVVSLKRGTRSHSFLLLELICYRLNKPRGLEWLEVCGKLKKKNIIIIDSRTRDLLACSTVTQQTALQRTFAAFQKAEFFFTDIW
jgi:hypothetical protein